MHWYLSSSSQQKKEKTKFLDTLNSLGERIGRKKEKTEMFKGVSCKMHEKET